MNTFAFRFCLTSLSCALALPAFATPTPEQRKQPSCSDTMQTREQAKRQARQADLDGRGVCALQDGGIGAARRGNAGSTAGGSRDATSEDGDVRAYADSGDTHRLRPAGRVMTVDMAQDTQRSGVDAWGQRHGDELFSQHPQPEPIQGLLTDSVPLDAVETLQGLAAGQFALRAAAAAVDGRANPGLAGGPLTSRDSGRIDAEDASAPSPVPEPDTWALLLGGLAVLACLARRQRR